MSGEAIPAVVAALNAVIDRAVEALTGAALEELIAWRTAVADMAGSVAVLRDEVDAAVRHAIAAAGGKATVGGLEYRARRDGAWRPDHDAIARLVRSRARADDDGSLLPTEEAVGRAVALMRGIYENRSPRVTPLYADLGVRRESAGDDMTLVDAAGRVVAEWQASDRWKIEARPARRPPTDESDATL
jgi:hypothetical protein